ncbi:uncharacterized protein N7506_011155 [Penicillium brevicompactum]|uniref:uncharacterized protein n=1 Tax=Penicillium brevicompactum TaxID=5074 RepID=UPI00253FB52C|nr:uncharacterized protein N7506_011155 [Penicillium brevicompactum]KAJ5322025.1 hypothetical protein N7506_011155 [Penicillium brevicompactum]
MTPLVEAYKRELFPWASEECKWLTVEQLAGLAAKTGYRRHETLPLPLLTAKGTPTKSYPPLFLSKSRPLSCVRLTIQTEANGRRKQK